MGRIKVGRTKVLYVRLKPENLRFARKMAKKKSMSAWLDDWLGQVRESYTLAKTSPLPPPGNEAECENAGLDGE